MLSYASYSFNKSHALSYAIMAYWTMWCKYYYPIEFLCANLNYGTDKGKESFVSEAHRLGLNVKLPSINNSDSIKWQVKDGNLYVPLIEIKGIGHKMLENRFNKKEEIKEVKTKSKRKGFFDLGIEKIGKKETVIKKGKLEGILEKIAELRKEENYEELQKYFSFKIRRE
jgi:DNA polymerase-3 subunit alpha